jgi:hypothetical protein
MDEAKNLSTDKAKKETDPLTLEGLLKQLKAKNLVPVRVIDSFSVSRKKLRIPAFDFDGTLSEFIDTSVSLNIKAIFVSASKLDEEEFRYEAEPPIAPPDNSRTIPRLVKISKPGQPAVYRREPIPEPNRRSNGHRWSEAEENLPESIDLVKREPRLKPFLKRIGQHSEYFVSFSCSEAILRLRVQEPWYTDLERLLAEVTQAIDEENENAIIQQQNKADEEYKKQEEENAVLFASIKKTLLKDTLFMSLSDPDNMEDHLQEKYPDVAAKLGGHLGRLFEELLDEQDKEEEKLSQERNKKLASLKQTLPEDKALMALRNKTEMRAYLLGEHPELFETLITVRRAQEDFINWLYLQKQKKRA